MEKVKISHGTLKNVQKWHSIQESEKNDDYDDDITSSAYEMRRSEKIEVKWI